MFEALFAYPKALGRHREGPWAEARERYLEHCASKGAAYSTLLRIARELLVIAERIGVQTTSPQSIKLAGCCWARYQRRPGRSHTTRFSEELSVQVASAWLRFLGRLEEPQRRQPSTFDAQLEDFIAYLRDERGLSSATIQGRCWQVRRFFEALIDSKGSLEELTVEDVDNFLSLLGKQGWCRVSVATSAKALRAFFRHAGTRGWCDPGIAAAIDAPRGSSLRDSLRVRTGRMFSGSL
jgi:integrase/recombinase XerD